MEDSSSRTKYSPKKLRRLSQPQPQASDEDQQANRKPSVKKHSQSKPKKTKRSKEKSPKKSAKKKQKAKPSVEVIFEEKSESQSRHAHENQISDKRNEQTIEEKKNSLYKSSEESDEEAGVLGFVGLKEAENKTRQTKPKREKKQIRTSNRFFKDQNFHNNLDYLEEAETAEHECLELNILVKPDRNSKVSDFLAKKALAAKKAKSETAEDVTVVNSQLESSMTAQMRQNEMKRLVSNESSQADEFDIELQVPRVNNGKKNQIVDNTLFVKKLADKKQSTVAAVAEEKLKPRKKVSREEYMREIDEDIKNRRAQTISSQEICSSFVMSTLNDLGMQLVTSIVNETPSGENSNIVDQKETKQAPQTTQSPLQKQSSEPPLPTKEIDLKLVQKAPNEHSIVQERPAADLEPKKQQGVKSKAKPKKADPMLRFFDDEAEESGKEKASGSDGEDGDLPDLINDNVEFDENFERCAYQKFLQDEFKRDEELIRRITTKQYPIKKKYQWDLDPNESKKARLEDIKLLVKKRNSEEKEERSSQQLEPTPLLNNEEEPEVDESLSSQAKVEFAAKTSACRWSFAEPIKNTSKDPAFAGKRNSLLSVAIDGSVITNFKPKQKKEPKMVGSGKS